RHDQRALARGFGVDQLVEAEPAHGREHRLHMAVGARSHHLQAVLDRPELLALENAPDRLDLLDGQRRQVGERALPDVLAVAHALTQKVGGPRVAVGDRVDVHDASESRFARLQAESSRRIHGYRWTLGPARKSAEAPIPPAVAATRPKFHTGNFGLTRYCALPGSRRAWPSRG